MPGEELAHRPLHRGVEVHRVDDQRIGMALGERAQRQADVAQALAEALAPVTGDQHQAAAGEALGRQGRRAGGRVALEAGDDGVQRVDDRCCR